MSDANFSNKLSRDERWEARKRAKFSQENSFEVPQREDPRPAIFANPTYEPVNPNIFSNYPDPAEVKYQQYPPEPVVTNSNPNFHNPQYNFSPQQSVDVKKQQEHRGRTPPSNSFFMNPVSEAEIRRQRQQEEYKQYAMQDLNRRKEEIPAVVSNSIGRGAVDQQQSEDIKKRNYNLELKRQIEERESNKRNHRQQEKAEEYFPFGKPGAGAPNRDSSGRIIAARPPKFNENDPNFNKPAYRSPQLPLRPQQDYYENAPQYPPQYAPPQYNNPPQYNPPPPAQYNPPPQYAPSSQFNPPQYPPSSQFNPPQYAPPPQYTPPPGPNQYSPKYANPPVDNYKYSNLSPPPDERVYSDPAKDFAKSIEDSKKLELQRALAMQIEEKQRKKDEEKRRKMLEERYEEEKLMKERQELENEFRREAEKKKKQINDLQSFNSNNLVTAEPVRKGRRPRTPIEMPAPEAPGLKVFEESKRRGQSAISRSPINPAPNSNYPPQNSNYSNPNEIPQEYINYLNTALERKITELKSDFKVHEMRQQEEILRLKSKNQVNNEQNLDAQREIDRLKDELRRKQVDEDIRHKELALALANTRNVGPSNTRLPAYEPRPVILPKSHADASLSLDFASRSLVSESKFIPLPNPTELFPIDPPSPKEKKALRLDTVFPSLPDSSSNYDTFRSASSSLGIDNILKKNEERLKVLEKFDPNTQDELNKLDEILFKFGDSDKNEPERRYDPPRRTETPGILGRGEYLPSIKELDGEATYSLPEFENRPGYNVY